jgi:hypothetical protein
MNISKSQKLRDRTRRCSQRHLAKVGELGSRPMTRFDGANLLKRRLKDAGIVGDLGLLPPLLQGDRHYELSGERRDSGGRSADCRPR